MLDCVFTPGGCCGVAGRAHRGRNWEKKEKEAVMTLEASEPEKLMRELKAEQRNTREPGDFRNDFWT